MDIKKFTKERKIWIPTGNVKNLHTFKKDDVVCFSKLPEEMNNNKELFNLYVFHDGFINHQIIIDKKTKDDLSKDLSFIKNTSQVDLNESMIAESFKTEKEKKIDIDLRDKLLVTAKKVEKKYVGKTDLIANSNVLIDYLTKFSEALIFVDDSKKVKNNEYITSKEDVENFLKESLPDLTLKNSFPTNKEPFTFLADLEKETIRMAMSAKTWIAEKDLNMIAVSLSDAIDVIKIGVDFSKFEFVKACDGISHLDTLVRDYFNDDIYSWKNDFQHHYKNDKNLGHEYEKTMKLSYAPKGKPLDNLNEVEESVKKVKKLK